MESRSIEVNSKQFTFFSLGTSDADKKKPTVILIQEWWGVTDQIKRLAQKLYDEGKYRVIVPDLYDGFVASSVDEATHSMNNLNFPEAVARMDAAADLALKEGSPKVGIAGFCMGGALTIAVCVKSAHVSCGSAFYGIPPREYFEWSECRCPLQGHFGEHDTAKGFADVATMRELEKALNEKQVVNQFFVYDANHAFMNDDSNLRGMNGLPEYNEEVAKVAWGNMKEWFDKYLN